MNIRKTIKEKVEDSLDGIEAEKTKLEPTISLKTYAEKRWGKTLKIKHRRDVYR